MVVKTVQDDIFNSETKHIAFAITKFNDIRYVEKILETINLNKI